MGGVLALTAVELARPIFTKDKRMKAVLGSRNAGQVDGGKVGKCLCMTSKRKRARKCKACKGTGVRNTMRTKG